MPSVLGIDVGRKNMGLCLVEIQDDGSTAIRRWDVVSMPQATALCMVRALDAAGVRSWASPGDMVAIECQMAKNPSMKRLEHYLEAYFTATAPTPGDYDVRVVDAKHKLAFAARTPWYPRGEASGTATWAARKKVAVLTTEGALASPGILAGDLADVFRASKKKDDLADSFLHAMAQAHLRRVIGEDGKSTAWVASDSAGLSTPEGPKQPRPRRARASKRARAS